MKRVKTRGGALFLLPSVFFLLGAASRDLPLLEAVKAKDATAVQALLQRRGVDVNAAEIDGTTALHWAVYHDAAAMVDRLIKAGANPKAANRYSATPLSLAATNGNAAVVERLLKAGVDANAALPGGETALMTASRTGKADAIRVLLAHGAQVNAKEELRGQTALMWAAAEGHAEAIKVLVEAGADIRAASHGPSTPPEITSGMSVFRRGTARVDAMTPLLFAVRAGHRQAVAALLDAGANVNEQTTTGMSALVLAIVNAHYELAGMLLDRGADANADKQGWTALHQVVRTRTLNIGQFPHPVPTGSMSGVDLAKKLLAKGAKVDAVSTKTFNDEFRGFFGAGATPYLVAAKGGDAELMQLLAEHGANPLATNTKGTTAIMAAAGVEMFNPNEDSGTNEDGLKCLQIALARGGDVNAVNADGDSAIHGAAYRGSTAIIQLLIDKGARLDIKNKRGFTPVQIANGEQLALVNIQKRPEALALLKKAMLDRGLTPQIKSDEEQYNFGVSVK